MSSNLYEYRINLNEMDVWLAEREGGKVSLPIGQIKEVRKLVLMFLCQHIDHKGADGLRAVADIIARAGNAEDENTD